MHETKQKSHTRLNPLNDYLFLKMMGEKGDEEQLLSFFNAILDRRGSNRVKSIQIIENRTFNAAVIGDKTSILDIRAILEESARGTIEVQLRNMGNMEKRTAFYTSQQYARSLDAGQDYREIPQVIAINIVDFNFLAVDNFHSCFHLREDTHQEVMLTDAVEIHFIEMPKFRRYTAKDIAGNPLHRWLVYLDKRSSEKEVEEIVKMDRAIHKAYERLEFVAQDKEALHAYQMRAMALSDWTSAVNYHRAEGLREGERKGLRAGKQEGTIEIARKLKGMNMSVGQIVKATGLSERQVQDL